MTTSRDLRDRVVFRYTDYDTPFWVSPNTQPGRWQRGNQTPTQYWCLHPKAAWAEAARAFGLRLDDELSMLRTKLWVARLDVAGLADYSDYQLAKEAGFPPGALIEDSHERCQDEADRLRADGFTGVIAPSAAIAGCINVTLFGQRIKGPWGVQPRISASIQATVAAVGSPDAGLAAQVRHHGDNHLGYESYLTRSPAEEPPSYFSDRLF